MLGTLGLTPGEALGLKWSDIDWEHSTLTVQRTLSEIDPARIWCSGDQDKSSRRTLTLGREGLAALKAHQDRQDFEHRKYDDVWQDQGLIFSTSLGTPLDQARIHRHWTAATTKADIPRYRIHDLRHSVASHLLAAGRPVERVARMLGHSNVTMRTKSTATSSRPTTARKPTPWTPCSNDTGNRGFLAHNWQQLGSEAAFRCSRWSEEAVFVGPLFGVCEGKWSGAPRRTRTAGTRFRKPLLYPPEL